MIFINSRWLVEQISCQRFWFVEIGWEQQPGRFGRWFERAVDDDKHSRVSRIDVQVFLVRLSLNQFVECAKTHKRQTRRTTHGFCSDTVENGETFSRWIEQSKTEKWKAENEQQSDEISITSQCYRQGQISTDRRRSAALVARFEVESTSLFGSTEVRHQTIEMSTLFLSIQLEDRHDSTRQNPTQHQRAGSSPRFVVDDDFVETSFRLSFQTWLLWPNKRPDQRSSPTRTRSAKNFVDEHSEHGTIGPKRNKNSRPKTVHWNTELWVTFFLGSDVIGRREFYSIFDCLVGMWERFAAKHQPELVDQTKQPIDAGNEETDENGRQERNSTVDNKQNQESCDLFSRHCYERGGSLVSLKSSGNDDSLSLTFIRQCFSFQFNVLGAQSSIVQNVLHRESADGSGDDGPLDLSLKPSNSDAQLSEDKVSSFGNHPSKDNDDFEQHDDDELEEEEQVDGNSSVSYLCSVCPFKRRNRCSLQRHLSVHSNGKAFLCPICSLTTIKQSSLIRHMTNIHPASQLPHVLKQSSTVLNASIIEQHQCHICSYRCEDGETMHNHFQIEHSSQDHVDEQEEEEEYDIDLSDDEADQSNSTPKNVYECPVCSPSSETSNFNDLEQLTMHVISEHHNQSCPFCSFTTNTHSQKSLIQHVRLHFNGTLVQPDPTLAVEQVKELLMLE